MNGHRTALVALAEAARAELDRLAADQYQSRRQITDRLAALDAALSAGDEAETDDGDEVWSDTVRAGVEARMTLAALRRSLCRALGRRTTRPQVFGPDTEIAPPADEVLLSDVAEQLADSKRYAALRSGLASRLGVDMLDDDRLLAVLADRLARAEYAQAETVTTPRED